MSTVSTFSALSSVYRPYPTSNTGNGAALPVNTRLGTSAPQADLDALSADQDTDATSSAFSTSSNNSPPPPPTNDDTTNSDTPTEPVVTSSVASADYRTLAKDLQAGNVAAVQQDEQKLQQDLAVTNSHGSHHPSGSALNVTV